MSRLLLPVRVFQILLAMAVLGLDASLINTYFKGFTFVGIFVQDKDDITLAYGAFVACWTILATAFIGISTTAFEATGLAHPILVVVLESISWAAWAAAFSLFAIATAGCVELGAVSFFEAQSAPTCKRTEAALGLSVAIFVTFCVTFVYSIIKAARRDNMANFKTAA